MKKITKYWYLLIYKKGQHAFVFLLAAFGQTRVSSNFVETNPLITSPFGNKLRSSLQSHPKWLMEECRIKFPHSVWLGIEYLTEYSIKSKHILRSLTMIHSFNIAFILNQRGTSHLTFNHKKVTYTLVNLFNWCTISFLSIT